MLPECLDVDSIDVCISIEIRQQLEEIVVQECNSEHFFFCSLEQCLKMRVRSNELVRQNKNEWMGIETCTRRVRMA